MTDTERLNLIEHYEWNINVSKSGKSWWITGKFSTHNKMVTASSLREAINKALDAQIKWSIG